MCLDVFQIERAVAAISHLSLPIPAPQYTGFYLGLTIQPLQYEASTDTGIRTAPV